MNTISGLKVHSSSNTLELIYADGSSATLAGNLLRQSCRCPECRRNQAATVAAALPTAILDIESIGLHGLRLHFSDGHTRGIYPLPYLAELADRLRILERGQGAADGQAAAQPSHQ